jgi:apolipoprotein N-acyltransferase
VAEPDSIAHDPAMQLRLERLGPLSSLAIASSSALILSLGAPPNGWLTGHWIGYVPLILMARRRSATWRQAALIGLIGGMGVGLGGFPWIAEMLVRFAHLPWVMGWLGLVLFSAWMAIPYAIWAVGLRLGPSAGWRSIVWPVALFVSGQSLWPVLFPYTPLLGFAEQPRLMQLAELGGVHLIEAVVVAAALFMARAVVAEGMMPRARALAIGLALPLGVWLHGGWRMQVLDAEAVHAPTLRVGVVQPNVPVGPVPVEIKMDRLLSPSARAQQAGAQLIVWPEAGAYPYGIARPFRSDRHLGTGRVMVHHDVPTLFGANTRAPGERFGYNSVFLLDPLGTVVGAYDKINLVPIGEYIPIIDPDWVTDWIPQIAHHHRGEAVSRFAVEVPGVDGAPPATIGVGPLICYEDIIPSFVREVTRQAGGIELFVNVTIDAWYGDSAEPWEHLALAQFRSVEHRIPMIRSVSTGVSAAIDYNGRLIGHLPARPVDTHTLGKYPPELMVEDIRLPRNTAERPTPFAQGGWLFPQLCQMIVVVSAGLWWKARRDGGRRRV